MFVFKDFRVNKNTLLDWQALNKARLFTLSPYYR